MLHASLSTFSHRLKALLLIIAGLLSIQVSLAQAGFDEHDFLLSLEGRETVFEALVSVFKENYWKADYTDWDAWAAKYRERALKAESREAFERVMNQMVDALGDDHSTFLGRGMPFADEPVSEDVIMEQAGLGIQHDYVEGIGIVIDRVFPSTPAEDAGLKRGDVITAINGKDITHSGRGKVYSLLGNSVERDEVMLDIKRKLEHLIIKVVPGPVRFHEVRYQPQASLLEDNIGYLYIPSFNEEGIAQEVHQRIAELMSQGVKALVLDLRDNPGGILGELGLVLGAFTEGIWAQGISREGLTWESSYEVLSQDEGSFGVQLLREPSGQTISRFILKDPVHFGGKVAVLVSHLNSSAGEVGPLVLQHAGLATIVGEVTEGNVESIRGFNLPDESLVLVAIANMQAADGTSFDAGITPDVIVSTDRRELASGYDAPLAQAIKALQGLPFSPRRFF
ncbi:MAG: S41 family peptidase [Deinococcales bacterium]